MRTGRATPLLVTVALATACATPRPRLDSGAAAEPRGPWSSPEHPALEERAGWEKRREAGARTNLIEAAYALYRDHLTKVDGARCEHRPTCSRYAIESVRAHGALVGAWLSVDRLMRGFRSSSLRALPLAEVREGRRLVADPVRENDFFFAP